MKNINKITLLWLSGMGVFLFLCILRTDHNVQLLISIFSLLLLALVYTYSRFPHPEDQREIIRLLMIYICLFLLMRYMYWRATETLPTQWGVISMVVGLLLFVAEAYSLINTLFGYFINSRPFRRKALPMPEDVSVLPDVDIYIPTYNEAPSILRATVIAATQMDYPAEKLHVYILDDGGTEQKCNDKVASKAAEARARAAELKEIASEFGAQYITRARNLHAKAGNINSALQHTNGDLLVILDCDHIPTRDFVEKTVGFFLADPKLFLVQTPHNFVSPDPIEKNLNTYEASPAENELFYDVMQPGLDFWGTSFFCGSAAVLRRSVINELGGISGQTITEDAETTIDALSLGYKTAYLNRPMVSGLQPETYAGFILQRVRWGQGMFQIFLLKNPWRQPGLKIEHRLLYTNFTFFWGFASSRFIMLLAPPLFLVFHINLCDATAIELISYAGPALIASLISTQYFYGRVRWPFMSQLYEIIQSVYISRGIWEVMKNPRSPSFQVTPKGEVLDRNFISGLAKPFYFILALNVTALVCGTIRYHQESWGEGGIAFVMFWAILDFIFLMGALGIMHEKRQLRSEPRVPHQENLFVHDSEGNRIPAYTINASASGMGLKIDRAGHPHVQLNLNDVVTLEFPQRGVSLQARVLSVFAVSSLSMGMGLSYQLASSEDERAAIDIAFGSSEQLIRNNRNRHQGRSIPKAFLYLLKFGFVHGVAHLSALVRELISKQKQQTKN